MPNCKKLVVALLLVLPSVLFACEKNKEIGADLHQKTSLPTNEIPEKVLKLIEQEVSGFKAQAAVTEFKNGMRYMDVEGKLPDGREIEFDLMLENEQWKVVEVQQDINPDEAPESVLAALNKSYPAFKIDRVIESNQGDGVIIYEFYSVQSNNKTVKQEVKLESGKAQILDQEWRH